MDVVRTKLMLCGFLLAIVAGLCPLRAQENPPHPAQKDPVTCLTRYFRSIDDKAYFEAYKLRSSQASQELSWQAFLKQWDTNLSPKQQWSRVPSMRSTWMGRP